MLRKREVGASSAFLSLDEENDDVSNIFIQLSLNQSEFWLKFSLVIVVVVVVVVVDGDDGHLASDSFRLKSLLK